MRRSTWLIGLAVVLVAAGGIALWASAVPRTVAPRPVEWITTVGELELTVVDPQGLVLGVRAGAATDIVGGDIAVANPSGDHRQLAVRWHSLPCETRPRIGLEADPGVVRLTIERDVRDPRTCESMGVGRNITLDLAVDVRASGVQIEVSD